MNDLYNTNNDFKEYVDRYATKHSIDVSVALTHEMVRLYAEYLKMR